MNIMLSEFTVKMLFPGFIALNHIEEAGRTCYKSSKDGCLPGINPAYSFVKSHAIDGGHESMLEHVSVSVKVICDLGVSQEWTRHRLVHVDDDFVFDMEWNPGVSQESTRYCVAGNMKLTTKNPHYGLTLSDLYKKKINSCNGSWKRIGIRQYNERTGELQFCKINDIFYSGVKPVIKINTFLGYSIVATADHKIYTDYGYVAVKELLVGGCVAVNGSCLLYKNRDWLYNQYNVLNKTAVDISREFGFGLSAIKSWVRKHKLPKKPKSYFNIGRKPWNAGLDGSDERVKRQINSLRENHWNEGRYTGKQKKDRLYKLGKGSYRKIQKNKCEICSSETGLNVHHVDGDRNNNAVENLITTCASCHFRIHSKNLETIFFDKIVSIESVGFVDVYDVSVMSDFKNFVSNGVVVHNCNYSKDKFDNSVTFIDPIEHFKNPESASVWIDACKSAEKSYLKLIELGESPQMARSVLNRSTKTEMFLTANLREWRKFFKLRAAGESGKPHPQMLELTIPMLKKFKELIPVVFDDIEIKCG
jgi:thymidylate synthase ThyX